MAEVQELLTYLELNAYSLSLGKSIFGEDTVPFEKTNSKGIIDLNAEPDTIRLLEDNIGENDGLECGSDFSDTTPKDPFTREEENN